MDLTAESIHRKFYILSYEKVAALLLNYNCAHYSILYL